jgi:predicted nucleic acid-binding protein
MRMGRVQSESCLTDPKAVIVIDASVAINLNATGIPSAILGAIPNRVCVVDTILEELYRGKQRGRQDADLLRKLISSGQVGVVRLGDEGTRRFHEMVIGPAIDTLDDGEAATIAWAVECGAVALVDERKAIRLCRKLHPSLRIGCSLDLFMHSALQRSLGRERLAQAVLDALRLARMRVQTEHLDWVLSLIGRDHAAGCLSLPSSVRHLSGPIVE